MDRQSAPSKWFGINWQISLNCGWGILGFNLAAALERDGRFAPVPLVPTIHVEHFPENCKQLMEKVLARERIACQKLEEQKEGIIRCEFPVLHSLGNWLDWESATEMLERVRGSLNLAIIFLENTQLHAHGLAVSKRYDLILAGSSWNNQVLRQNGIQHVETFLQGVDLSLFRLARRPSGNGPFVIFSGGKLEYRKGQDIVVAAFRKFQKRHPDSILATTWHNLWPKSITGMDRAGHVIGVPSVDDDGRLDVVGWLEANGINRANSRDLGVIPNYLMPAIYSQADAAVFPNRCEGGTNLVAMECLACGVPTILSANTGHLDLVNERHCYPLRKQGPVQPIPPFFGTEGWGESDVDEVVEALERIYSDRKAAEQKGAAAAQFMQDWSWRARCLELIEHLRRFTPVT